MINLEGTTWDDDVVHGLEFVEHSVLQVPFFLMTMMRHLSPTLDNLFMESLQWVDQTYLQKHKSESPDNLRAMYYPNLNTYPTHGTSATGTTPYQAAVKTGIRYGRKAGISLAVLAASYIPYVGRFVLPAASFYTFRKAVGTQPASVIFGVGVFLPRHYLVTFLQTYFASRSLMRELVRHAPQYVSTSTDTNQLVPYFARVRFTKEQKRQWFRDREGVLFGFALGFFTLIKIPLVGVLVYGIAEASTAFLITKVTEPPPPPSLWEAQSEDQVHWRNKHEFLKQPLEKLDALNVSVHHQARTSETTLPEGKKFT